MRTLIVLLAACAVAAAMVPRARRDAEVCAQDTPCAWAIYNPSNHVIQNNITNSYCNCSADKDCIATKDDKAVDSYVFYCRLPSENEDIINS